MAGERRFEPWPAILTLLLATMMAVGVGFFVVASRNVDALVVEDAYEAGLLENDRRRERERAAALGVDLEVRTGPAPDGGLRVSVRAVGPGAEPVLPERVLVRRERPAEGGLDADFELGADAEGHSGVVTFPRPGRWHLIVTAIVEGLPVRERFALHAG